MALLMIRKHFWRHELLHINMSLSFFPSVKLPHKWINFELQHTAHPLVLPQASSLSRDKENRGVYATKRTNSVQTPQTTIVKCQKPKVNPWVPRYINGGTWGTNTTPKQLHFPPPCHCFQRALRVVTLTLPMKPGFTEAPASSKNKMDWAIILREFKAARWWCPSDTMGTSAFLSRLRELCFFSSQITQVRL